jgi:DUF917 family protein
VSLEKTAANELMESQQLVYKHVGTKPTAMVAIEIGGGNGLMGKFTTSSSAARLTKRKWNRDDAWVQHKHGCTRHRWRLDGSRVPNCDTNYAMRIRGRTAATAYCHRGRERDHARAPPSLLRFHMFMTLKFDQLMAAAKDETMVERVFRAVLAELGSAVAVAFGPYSGLQTRQYAVQHTLSLAWRIGRAVASCRAKRDLDHVAEAIVNAVGGNRAARVLGKGKVVGVERRLLKGHAYGEVIIEEKTGKKMKIPYKNENIVATIETNGDDEVGWEF